MFGTNPKPRGRWAQKGSFEPDVLDLRNSGGELPNITYAVPIPNTLHVNNQTSDYNSGSSKDVYNNTYLSEDSSIDSGMENRRDLLFLTKNVGSLTIINLFSVLSIFFLNAGEEEPRQRKL